MKVFELSDGKDKRTVVRRSKSTLWRSLSLEERIKYKIKDITPKMSKIGG